MNIVSGLKVLFHCFAPTDDLVKLVIDNGYFVAFGGNITYNRNDSFKKYIKMIPVSQMVIETDLPYLSPVPFRGKVNSSANLSSICKKLSEYVDMDEAQLSEILYNNSINFFDFKV
ncbi:MAG: TatD family hydrolase [Clostridia bacterium]